MCYSSKRGYMHFSTREERDAYDAKLAARAAADKAENEGRALLKAIEVKVATAHRNLQLVPVEAR